MHRNATGPAPMTYDEYYCNHFRNDLGALLAAAPPSHECSWCRDEITLQPKSISRHNGWIAAQRKERLALLTTALYFTVLVDQVMYTYFSSHYDEFQRLTKYPKFRGDCPGGCRGHAHPSRILMAMNRPPGARTRGIPSEVSRVLQEALPVMLRETIDFFEQHMPRLDGSAVWHRCSAETPPHSIVAPDSA